MSNQQQSLEDIIRQTLEQLEVPYNQEHWREMEGRLNLLTQGLVVSMSSFYTAFVIAGVFMAGLIYFGLPDGARAGYANNEEEIEEEFPDGEGSGTETAQLADWTAKSETEEQTNAAEIHTTITEISEFVMEVPTSKMESLNEDVDVAQSDDKETIVEYGEMTVKRIKSSVAQGCEGTPITFSTAGSDAEGNYLWNFGDGIFSNKQDPVHVFASPGVYDVSLLVTPLTGGKLTPMTIEDQIKINPRPKASFDFTMKQNELNMPKVQFENHTKNASKAIWMIDGQVVAEENGLTHHFTKRGNYKVSLVAMNEFGCSDTSYKYVEIAEDYNLMAPEVFSPTGSAPARTFMPEALRKIPGTFVMRITDPKTDMVIFETTDINQPWEGKIAGTTVSASSGVYQWEVTVTSPNGTVDVFDGTVRLRK
ncbi:MAG: PKD domain-containing protein [Cryomorphaceae bacterium]|nr:MAG: PKD domain-containing protein [Cryomorphaceae bacterium]